MLILDTNHYSEMARRSAVGSRLAKRIEESSDSAFLTIITAAEVLRGWLAAIKPHLQPDRGIYSYGELQESIASLAAWVILPWTDDAADTFDLLKPEHGHIGTLDLRIASIALEYDATVLTRNLKDFNRIPGLKFENWLD